MGGEKLGEPIAAAFREKFGVELLEGYGCAEMSPVIAVNTPDFEWGKYTQIGTKPGSVGHPLPGVAARIVDPVSFEPLPPNTEGLLLVKGSNRMAGYLNDPERTAWSFAMAGTLRATRARSTTKASCASPAGSPVPARGPARRC